MSAVERRLAAFARHAKTYGFKSLYDDLVVYVSPYLIVQRRAGQSHYEVFETLAGAFECLAAEISEGYDPVGVHNLDSDDDDLIPVPWVRIPDRDEAAEAAALAKDREALDRIAAYLADPEWDPSSMCEAFASIVESTGRNS